MRLSLIRFLIILETLFELIRSECFPSQILLNAPSSSTYSTGPTSLLPVNKDLIGANGEFGVAFWLKVSSLNAYADDQVFVPLRIESINPTTNTVLYTNLEVVKVSNNNIRVQINGDKDPVNPGKVQGNYNNYLDRWVYFSIIHSNQVGSGSIQLNARSAYNFIKTVAIDRSEPWDFQGLLIRTMSDMAEPTYYFPGSLTKVDFYADFFIDAGTKLDFMQHGLPEVLYLVDFTDPEHTQYFKNRVNNQYTDAIRGQHNHTDIHDFYFGKVNGFSMRHYAEYMQLPFFAESVQHNFNQIIHIKFKGYGLNHWHKGNMYYFLWQRRNNGGSVMHMSVRKYNYASYLRLRLKIRYTREYCTHRTSPDSHLAYTTDYGFNVHIYISPIEQREKKFVGCNGYIANARNTGDGKIGITPTDNFYIMGGFYQPGATFFDEPYRAQFDRNRMQLELMLQLLIITQDGYKSNPYRDYPDVCAANTVEQYGPGPEGFRAICENDYSPYHELNQCIRDPFTEDFKDCAHDMDSVGGKCYRCPRYYGKQGTQGCFKCFDKCIECSGSGDNECTYCDAGFGFTGTSCLKCTLDETWDLSRNICQLKKVRYVEADYGYQTFGEVVLMFRPLDGKADMSLYTDNRFDRYWIIDINRQYYVIRDYPNLPLHRKVSISFEFLIIDTRNWGYSYAAVDKEYFWSFSANLEDPNVGSIDSYWGYGYKDLTPQLVTYTNFHSADSMQLGIVTFMEYDWSTIWVRNINTTFFGCYEACATCWEDNSPVHCTSCLPGYYLVGTECKACNPICNTCDVTPTNCTSCPDGEFLKGTTCFTTCGLGYFPDATDNNNCKQCPNECVQCNSLTSCNSCKNGFYLAIDQCLPCDTAGANCVTCVSTATKCLSCPDPMKLEDFSCVGACSTSFYEVPGRICNPCPHGCLHCDSSSCSACKPTFLKKGNFCANPCGTGWYASSATDCSQCDGKCKTCSGTPTGCLVCATGRAQVAPSCPVCQPPCLTCSTSATTCTACQGTKYLSGTTCVEAADCPAGTFARNNQCEPCDLSLCETCVTLPYRCLSCTAPKVLSGTICIANCPLGYDAFGQICCPDKCTTCTNSQTCQACKPGNFLDGVTCKPCDSNCLSCQTTSTTCLTCPPGQVLQGTKCLPACLDKYYPAGSVCQPCEATCATCSGPTASQCLTCISGHMLWDTICQNCADPNNAYFVNVDGVCWDKCGNGMKFTPALLPGLGGYNSCDDGNLFNGDGCSASCKIEKNYRCEGGSVSTADQCFSKIKPSAILKKIFKDKYQIQLSHPIQFKTKEGAATQIGESVTVSIEGFSSPKDFTYTLDPQLNSEGFVTWINIKLVFTTSIPESEITVTYERESITDSNTNTLKNQKTSNKVEYIIPDRLIVEPVTEKASIAGKAMELAVPLTSFAVTNYVSMAFSRFAMKFQMLCKMNLVNTKKGSEMQYVLSGVNNQPTFLFMGPSQMMKEHFTGLPLDKSKIVEPVPEGIKTEKDVEGGESAGTAGRVLQTTSNSTSSNSTTNDTNGTNSTNGTDSEAAKAAQAFANMTSYQKMFSTYESVGKFKENDYGNAMLGNMSANIVILMIGIVWYFMTSVLCGGCINPRSNCLVKFFVYGGERCFFIGLLLNLLELSIFSMNNLMHPSFDTPIGILSSVLALVTVMFVILFPGVIYLICAKHYSELWHPDYYDRYAYLFCEFKLNRRITKVFMTLIMARLVLFGFLISILQTSPVYQTISILVVNLVYFVVLYRYQPFVSWIVQKLTTFGELFLIFANILFVISAIDDQSDTLGSQIRRYNDLATLIFLGICAIAQLLCVIYMILMKIKHTLSKCISGRKFNKVHKDDIEEGTRASSKGAAGQKGGIMDSMPGEGGEHAKGGDDLAGFDDFEADDFDGGEQLAEEEKFQAGGPGANGDGVLAGPGGLGGDVDADMGMGMEDNFFDQDQEGLELAE